MPVLPVDRIVRREVPVESAADPSYPPPVQRVFLVQVHSETAVSLEADGSQEVRVPFRPTRCGTYHLVAIAGKGTPFEAERTARPLHVNCPTTP